MASFQKTEKDEALHGKFHVSSVSYENPCWEIVLPAYLWITRNFS